MMARRRRSLSSDLYQAARVTNDLEVLTSGNPRRVRRRLRNIVVGRALARAGVWRKLWGKW